MGLSISRVSETQYNPCFLSILEDIPGGGTIATDDLASGATEIKAGTVVGEDSVTAGLFHIIKTAEVYSTANGADNTIQIAKGHNLKAGDFVSNGAKSTAISSIDTTTSDDYDTLTVVSGFAHTDGDTIYWATSEGTEAADIAEKYTAIGLTRDNIDIVTYSLSGSNTAANVSSGIVVRGTVNESLLPSPVSAASKTALTDRIRFA